MTQRYDLLPEAAKRLARVPRTGRLLARLPLAAYERLKADADVYWQVYTFQTRDGTGDCGLLADGLKVREARRLAWRRADERAADDALFRRHQIRRAADLLGAIAFEMMATPTGPVDTIDESYLTFQDRVRRRFLASGAFADQHRKPEDADDWSKDWNCLLAMDSHGLKHFIFSTDARDQQLRWTDVTTMAFFAAYWASRWAKKADRTLMRAWVIDPLENRNKAFREFWTFAAQMPDDAIEGRRKCWEALFAPLYNGSLTDKNGPIRSTEFIYRTWERMKETPAQEKFLSEFQEILAGEKGLGKKKTADILLAGFISLVKKPVVQNEWIGWVPTGLPSDTGTFLMGELPTRVRGIMDYAPHTVVLSPYRLHRFCVTNLEYELFDPRHQWMRWSPDQQHPLVAKGKAEEPRDSVPDDSCPVVMVSWYDAWCFSQWLGEVEIDNVRYKVALPTEAQWEYACRAGRSTPFTFHEDHNGLTCTAEVCNCNGNYPFDEGSTNGPVRHHTVPVNENAYHPNRWGFWQMHGNVAEWCLDWYAERFYATSKGGEVADPANADRTSSRVLRGGFWGSDAWFCRSGHRGKLRPAASVHAIGIRLTAVPIWASSRT